MINSKVDLNFKMFTLNWEKNKSEVVKAEPGYIQSNWQLLYDNCDKMLYSVVIKIEQNIRIRINKKNLFIFICVLEYVDNFDFIS